MAFVRATRLLKGLRLRSLGGSGCGGGALTGSGRPISNRFRGRAPYPLPFWLRYGLGDLSCRLLEYGLGLRRRFGDRDRGLGERRLTGDVSLRDTGLSHCSTLCEI
jgi:hypothetical protein